MPLELRRKPDGSLSSKWWYGRYEVHGKRMLVNLGVRVEGHAPASLKEKGSAGFEQSRGSARKALQTHQNAAIERKAATTQLEQIYELRTGEKVGLVPLDELASAWEKIPHPRERSPRYLQQSLATLKGFVSFVATNYPEATSMDRVNRQIAEAWLASVAADGIGPATYNDKLVLLRSVFKALRHKAGLAWNPFDGLPTRKRNTVHRQPFTSAELKSIVEHADPILRPVIITGICTAMREGDCCLLRWQDVNLKQGYIVVKTSKTGETAEIPILPMLREVLEGAVRVGEYVWPAAAEMFQKNRYGIIYRTGKAIEAAGITGAVEKVGLKRNVSVKDFHSLRTTWITLALSAGVPMELVRRVTGHTTTDVVLKHYFRPGRKEFRKSIERAMPRLLMDGGAVKQQKSPVELLVEAVKAAGMMSAEDWQAQRDAMVKLVQQALKCLREDEGVPA